MRRTRVADAAAAFRAEMDASASADPDDLHDALDRLDALRSGTP